MSRPSLVAIVGPTASGKSSLALQIAQQFDGEIIAADSRTIYRGMDIGTAKPSADEQKMVSHHLLDVVDPDEPFTAADFKRLANEAINDIQSRAKLPIVVGGTGLYVDALLYDFSFAQTADPKLRAELNKLSLHELQSHASDAGIVLNNSDWHNPRRLVRALESGGEPRQKQPLRSGAVVVGLSPQPESLNVSIESRVDSMLQAGLLNEVRQLGERYGWEGEALTGIGYRELIPVVQSAEDIKSARSQLTYDTKQLAKHQLTWFKRNLDINWFESAAEAHSFIESILNPA